MSLTDEGVEFTMLRGRSVGRRRGLAALSCMIVAASVVGGCAGAATQGASPSQSSTTAAAQEKRVDPLEAVGRDEAVFDALEALEDLDPGVVVRQVHHDAARKTVTVGVATGGEALSAANREAITAAALSASAYDRVEITDVGDDEMTFDD